MTNNIIKKITIVKTCLLCCRRFGIVITNDQYERYLSGGDLNFDFDDLPRDERLSLGTGFCGNCWREEFMND